MSGPATYVKRGKDVDITLTLEMRDGLFFAVQVDDKLGRHLEHFELSFDKSTVMSWVTEMARQAIFHR
jgi:hypothetical protein